MGCALAYRRVCRGVSGRRNALHEGGGEIGWGNRDEKTDGGTALAKELVRETA